jgi:hypothetical protein
MLADDRNRLGRRDVEQQDQQEGTARGDGLTFHTEDGIIIFIQRIAVLPSTIRVLHPHSFILPHNKINVPRIRTL